jgi:hypothetical protein
MPRGRPAREPRLILAAPGTRAPVWYIHWNDGEKQRKRSTATGDRREADEIFAQWLLDRKTRDRGQSLRASYPHEVAIADVLADFIEQRSQDIRFPERHLYAIRRLSEWWADHSVDAITLDTCRAYGDARTGQGIKPATVIKELSVLRAALKWAKRRGRLITIPEIDTPPKPPGKERFLTRQEAARLLWAARKEPKSRLHLPLFILIGLYSGLAPRRF